MTLAVDLERKATKQTNKQKNMCMAIYVSIYEEIRVPIIQIGTRIYSLMLT